MFDGQLPGWIGDIISGLQLALVIKGLRTRRRERRGHWETQLKMLGCEWSRRVDIDDRRL